MTSYSSSSLLADVGVVVVDGVVISVGEVSFHRTHIGGDARDTYLEIDFSFDRGNELQPENFALVSAEGMVFGADLDQAIALHQAQLRFSVDGDIATLSGWQLRIEHNGTTASIDL